MKSDVIKGFWLERLPKMSRGKPRKHGKHRTMGL
jgi:hypothetical protein